MFEMMAGRSPFDTGAPMGAEDSEKNAEELLFQGILVFHQFCILIDLIYLYQRIFYIDYIICLHVAACMLGN